MTVAASIPHLSVNQVNHMYYITYTALPNFHLPDIAQARDSTNLSGKA